MVWADLSIEKDLWKKGYQYIAGIDEVGRGSWAGPVVAASVIFPKNFKPRFQLADSKLLNIKKRAALAEEIKKTALCYAISKVELPHINRYGIGRSSQQAFRKSLSQLPQHPDYHLIDAFYIKYLPKGNQKPILKGDQKSFTIAAASIIAKVYRDALMEKLALEFPRYGFERHRGYGTKEHQLAIRTYGLSELHRKSFDLSFLTTNKYLDCKGT
jgi:ribonuclease HII